MSKKKTAIYFVILAVALVSVYVYFAGNGTREKTPPHKETEVPPATEKTVSPQEKKEDIPKGEIKPATQLLPATSSMEPIEYSPSVTPVSHGESINLAEHSYSIRNEKKEIYITPGVTLQPGKSINIKIPGEDEIIRVQRDKNYHPGGYNVLVEKKF